jgi:hypothetical protein
MDKQKLLVKRPKDVGFIERACIRKQYENLFKLYNLEEYIESPVEVIK